MTMAQMVSTEPLMAIVVLNVFVGRAYHESLRANPPPSARTSAGVSMSTAA